MHEVSGGGTQAFISEDGAMITATFNVGGRTIDPFYVSPWDSFEADPLLNNLRGDFLCVPFGIAPESTKDFPQPWSGFSPEETEYPHGYSAVGKWVPAEDGSFTLEYPEGSPISSIKRTVVPTEAKVTIEDEIFVDHTTQIPIGLHPIFKLPETSGAAEVTLPAAKAITTYPVLPTDISILAPNTEFASLTEAPTRDGNTLNATLLPLNTKTEELICLLDVENPSVSITNNSEKYRVTLTWDNELLKHCMLWVSNYGRDGEPWLGRNLCLGIEPITSAFDLGNVISTSTNPLNEAGFDTAVTLEGGQSYKIRHSISVEAI